VLDSRRDADLDRRHEGVHEGGRYLVVLEEQFQGLAEVGQRLITVTPWLATSTSRQRATNHSPSFTTAAVSVRAVSTRSKYRAARCSHAASRKLTSH